MRQAIVLLLLLWFRRCQCAITWNSPTDGYNVMVFESKAIGSEIVTLNATATGFAITYTIIDQKPNQAKFGIQSTNKLYLKSELNYEDIIAYTVLLSARESFTDDTADVSITINVLDVNDEEPVVASVSSVTLSTDTKIGSVVYILIATDADTVGSLIYSIKSGNENDEFIINSFTGEITLNGTFDIENKAEYDLVLEVTDGVFTVEEQVTFYLTDVIWRSPLNNQRASVPEGKGSDNWHITLDADNAAIYSLTQIPVGNEFRIRNNEELYVAETLDYETTKLYTLNLKALALTGRTADITFIVEVTDLNDEPLHFTPEVVTVDVSQGIDIGTIVYKPTTSDPDTVGRPTFFIADGNSNDTFSINSTTGELSLDKSLDPYVTEYNITIHATDGVFTANLSLTVTVNNVIWRTPKNKQGTLLPENTSTWNITLNADNAVYYHRYQTPTGNVFRIKNTNELYLAQSLDYETTKLYTIDMKAVDSTGRSATISYTVEVTDVNDEPLKFAADVATVDVPKDAVIGTIVYIPSTTDPDTVGSSTFFIADGNTNDTFSINSTSGQLSLERLLDPDVTEYNIVIEATDGVFIANMSLIVTVNNVTCRNTCLPDPQMVLYPCDVTSGACLFGCYLGYACTNCTYKCPENCSISDNNRTEVCNDTTGECLFGCKDGFYGLICERQCYAVDRNCKRCFSKEDSAVCEECHKNFYRDNGKCRACNYCQNSNTSSLPSCRENDGYCNFGCTHGRYGNTCGSRCPSTCKDICHKGTGKCLTGCKYQTYCGPTCETGCNDGCVSQQCDQSCTCSRGCKPTTWGERCDHLCNNNCKPPPDSSSNICDRSNGSCLYGCNNDNFWGSQCEKSCSSECAETENVNSLLLGGVVSGWLLSLVLCAVLAVIARRHQMCNDCKGKKKVKDERQDVANSDQHEYMTLQHEAGYANTATNYDVLNLEEDRAKPRNTGLSGVNVEKSQM